MNAIVIYHHPQECGSPYLTFISQESGKVIETVDLPEPQGYYYSGEGEIRDRIPVEHFTEQYHRNLKPRMGRTVPAAHYRPNPNRYEYEVTKITDIRHDSDVIPTWRATLHVTAYQVDIRYEYYPERDDYRNEMDKLGFDMTHWTLPERRKLDYSEFLKQIVLTYKDYHPINFIEIG